MYYFAILAFLTGMLNLFLGVYSFSVSAKKAVNTLFLIFSSLLAVWSLFYAFVYIAPTKEYAWIFYDISSIGWVFFPSVLLHFSILLRDRRYQYNSSLNLLMYIPPLVFQFRILTDYLLTVDMTHTKLGWIHVFNKNDNIWVYSFLVYMVFYVVVSIYNIYMYGRKSLYKSQKNQSNILLASVVLVTIVGTLSDILIPRFLENQTVPAIANIFTSVWVIGASIAVVRYKLMVLTASIASEAILEKIKDMLILLNPAYRILEVNKQVEKLLAYSVEELVGEKVNILFEKNSLIDFELVKLHSREIEESSFESNIVTKNKQIIPAEVSISVVRDKKLDIIGYVLIAQDLRDVYQLKTEIKEKNIVTEALKNSEFKFRAFLEFLPISVAEVSLRRKIVYVNETVLKLFGYKREELDENFNVLDVIHPKDHYRLRFNYSRSIIGEKKEDEINEYLAVKKDGTSFPAKIYTNTIFENNVIVGLRVIFIDISEQKEYEESLTNAKEIAELADKAKSTFIANTSHEIRTPLNAIIGYTNLLLNQDLSENQRRYIKNIKTSGDNLLGIINDILEYSKIKSVKLEIQSIAFEIKKEVEKLINAISVKADEKNISIILYIDHKIPDVLIGDPVRINQILNNLIANAIKFTNSGGVVNVNVFLSREIIGEVELRFIVEDTGIGIPEDKLQSIFESFNQADYNTTRKYGGTGLGLSIVKHILEAHNSNIEVQSEVNKGSKFSFNIVFRKSQSEFIKKHVDSKNIILCKNHPQIIKILLAEDNPTNREIAIDIIRAWKENIEIDTAENGKIAIEKLKLNFYDLLLLDMQMPEMDGYDVAKYIRTEMSTPQNSIPIFAMTANAMKEEIKKCLDLGMNEYFSKPFIPEDLYSKIRLYTCSDIVEKRRRNEQIDYTCLYCKTDFTSMKEIKKNITFEFNKSSTKMLDLSHLEKIYKNDAVKIQNIINQILDEIPRELADLIKGLDLDDLKKVRGHAHTIKTKMLYIGAATSHEISKEIEQLCVSEEGHEKISFLISQLNEDWNQVEKELKILNSF
ncbi:MAG TPA: hypothetical protein DDX39_02565 [Bacteroidales bacterium]|nr:MAG: hypothetical protein A2W98_03580 [Bacteroidetes bacterium GWF2_33_38]OFY84844.1 MAG: hypothetical protein A2236_09220 [Bacteroidetes bacterium RIFOXYA2_FULL_33_7]HBF87499.1 hypothetical protein [Bacteroidales bacterium]